MGGRNRLDSSVGDRNRIDLSVGIGADLALCGGQKLLGLESGSKSTWILSPWASK